MSKPTIHYYQSPLSIDTFSQNDGTLLFTVSGTIADELELKSLITEQYGITDHVCNWDEMWDYLTGLEAERFEINQQDSILSMKICPISKTLVPICSLLIDLQDTWLRLQNPRWEEKKKRILVDIYFRKISSRTLKTLFHKSNNYVTIF